MSGNLPYASRTPVGSIALAFTDAPPEPTSDGLVLYANETTGVIDAVDSSGNDAMLVRSATVKLTSAQILGLGTSPVQIVPAPPTGKTIVPIGGSWKYFPGSTAYSFGVDYPSLALCTDTDEFWYGVVSGVAMLGVDNGMNTLVASTGIFGSTDTFDASSVVESQPLVLQCYDSNADTPTAVTPTSGNGTLTVNVLYYLVDLN
jgi:hypothetical protein